MLGILRQCHTGCIDVVLILLEKSITNEMIRTHCKRSAASYMPIDSELVSPIFRITSPDKIPALFAGPPGEAEITTSPPCDPSPPVG